MLALKLNWLHMLSTWVLFCGFGLLHGVQQLSGTSIMNKKKASPLMVMLSGVVGAGGGATPLVTGLDGVLNMRSVNENVPLSTVISLKRLSSFQAAVSSSNSLPEGQHTHAPCSGKQHNHSCSHYCGYETHSKPSQSHLNRQLFPAPAACL